MREGDKAKVRGGDDLVGKFLVERRLHNPCPTKSSAAEQPPTGKELINRNPPYAERLGQVTIPQTPLARNMA